MKKILILVIFCLVLFSCNDNVSMDDIQEDKSQIVYYKKDLRENFKKLLKNNGDMPLSDVVTKNAQEYEENGVLTEYDKLILEFWNDITDEQRE